MKSNIESILIANLYFTICKLENSNTEIAKKYLSVRINEALLDKKVSKKHALTLETVK